MGFSQQLFCLPDIEQESVQAFRIENTEIILTSLIWAVSRFDCRHPCIYAWMETVLRMADVTALYELVWMQ